MSVPAAMGYTVTTRKTFRGTWKWEVRLGVRPYGGPKAKGEAATPSEALEQAAAAFRATA